MSKYIPFKKESQEKVLRYLGENVAEYNTNFIRNGAISLFAKKCDVHNLVLGKYCKKQGVYDTDKFRDFKTYLQKQNIRTRNKPLR